MAIAAGGASRHRDLLGDPVHFRVMEGEPGVSYDHRLLSEVCDSEMRSFGMVSEAKSDMDFFHDSSVLIWGPIDIAYEDALGKWSGLKLVFLHETPVYAHTSSSGCLESGCVDGAVA